MARVASAGPSALSSGLLGQSEVSFMRAVERSADALDELVSRQQTGGLDHPPLAVDPLGLDGVQPGTLDRQVTRDDPHAVAGQLDLAVVGPDPGPDFATDILGRVVPDQQYGGLAESIHLGPAAGHV